MKIFISIKKTVLLLGVASLFFTACNKLELDPVPTDQPTQGTTPTLATLLDDANFSLLKAAVTKAGLMAPLTDPSLRFTVFAPDNAAIIASLGVPNEAVAAAYIASRPDAEIAGLISYHVVPQVVKAASIAQGFPNFQYPTILNPAPSLSPLLRLTTFPCVRPTLGAWVNNVPIIATDITAVNGVVHKVFRIVAPPTKSLWDTIHTSSDLTYLQAAIARADSGAVPGTRLQDALNPLVNSSAIGANLTIFAPDDNAMKTFLTGAITQALVAQGLPLATAQAAATGLVTVYGTTIISNPASIPDAPFFPPGTNIGPRLSGVLTPTLAKGIVVYHVISSQSGTYAPPGLRVFSVNLPTAATTVKTLLNSAVAVHPGVTVQATFASPVPGVSVVTAATVKGAANATASNITTKDINCVNGVIHKIDQVLLPQ